MNQAKEIYGSMMAALPDSWAVSLQFLRAHGKMPRLRKPRSFSEKIQWRKLNDRNPMFPIMVDKIGVKQRLAALMPDAIIPTLWSGTRVTREILSTLPLPFVLKASHSSGQNQFYREPGDLTDNRVAEANSWRLSRFRPHVREWAYSGISPGLLAEPFIGEGGRLPEDYKVFVFNGRARIVQVDTRRELDHHRVFFDTDWQRMPITLAYPLEPREISRPSHLRQMLALAEALAAFASTNFLRVDLYQVRDRVLFGEATFYPGSGYERFRPRQVDDELGDLWTLAP